MTITIQSAVDTFGVDILDYHDRELSVPVVSGVTRQGDVIVVPAQFIRRGLRAATTPVPLSGVAVVRGEAGGNTHSLHGDGPIFFDAARQSDETDLSLGTLTVPEGSVAYLAHPEHAFTGIAPGTYRIGRQREQMDEIRLVQD